MGSPIPSGLLEREISNAFNFDLNNVQELSENGFGLILVKTIFDKVDYQSFGGVNRICLRKIFPN
jgi:anti-sigma regulatory factor (Ser/Thr protein kinase)